jgi:hypothetical protein
MPMWLDLGEDQDANPQCGLGAAPEVAINNVNSPDSMDCCPENNSDLYVSTSMDFEEECIIGENYKHVIIFDVKTVAG